MSVRSFPRRLLAALAVLAVVLVGGPSPAWGDSLSNSLGSAGNDTVVVGGSTTVGYWLVADDLPQGDINNCNVNNGNPATITPQPPAGVTVSPASAAVTTCGPSSRVDFVFTGAAIGDHVVPAQVSGGRNGSRWNLAVATFTLHVLPPSDTTPPVLALPGTQTVEAAGPHGAAATWTATAHDAGDAASPLVTCNPASGSTFPLGTTAVSCSSSDSRGNTATGSFDVVVRDTTGPALTLQGATAEATGRDGASVSYTATALDLVDGTRPVTCVPGSGSLFGLGDTTVACFSLDSRGNRSDGGLTVRVQDTTPPVLTLTDYTEEASTSAGAVVDYDASASDTVSGDVPVTCDRASGSTFPLGATTVSCTATDGAGLTGTGSFTVTVGDTTGPRLTLQDVVAEATAPDGATVEYSASAHDDVSGTIEPDCAPGSGTTFALGETTVSCSVTDGAGNSTMGTLTVTVRDTTPPVLSLPDIVVEATGPSGATVSATGSASDIVDGSVTVLCDDPADTQYPLGETLVRCAVTDKAGNRASGTVTIRVVDTTAPVVSVSSVTREAQNADGAVVDLQATAYDVVKGDVLVACEPSSASTFPLGTTAVTCTATDGTNTGSAGATVTVVDTTAPAFSPSDVTAEATGPDGAVVTFSTAAVDLVDGDVQATCAPAPGTLFALGTTAVECEVRDSRGNFATSSFAVAVVDTTAPVLTLPAEIVAEATGPAGATVEFEATATDVVDGNVDVTCIPASGSRFGLGTTTVTCTAEDETGNPSTGSFDVLVRDTTGPSITVTSQTVEATGPDGASVSFEATATDLVDGDVPVTCDPESGNVFGLGETTVSCEAEDAAGNDSDATFVITVGDTTAPSLTLEGAEAEATGPDGATVTYEATAHDLVDGDRPVGCQPASGSIFGIGDTTVGCRTSDTRGNQARGTLTVTVKDTTPPLLMLPGTLTAEATGPDGAAVEFTATGVDIVDGNVAVDCAYDSGSTFPVGTTTVTCTAADTRGNGSSGSFDVVVTDTTAPVLSLPGDLTVEATGPGGAAEEFTATAEDIVDGDVAVTCLPASGSTFALGTTTVECEATDGAGNAGTGSFSVTVVDTTGPTVSVPTVTVEATGPNGAEVAFTATATDLVDGVIEDVDCTPESGSLFSLGTTAVTCTATDAAGNQGSAEGSVRVVDTTAPVLTVPGGVSGTATSAAGASVSYAASALDLVDGSPVVRCDPASGSVFAPGTTTVSCWATDAAGNQSATQTFTVNVTFEWSGLLQPISVDGRSAFKAGSTIPVKFALQGVSAGATGVPAKLHYAKVGAAGSTTEMEAVSTSAADTGNAFRYDSGAKQYIFNLSTKGWSEGQYQLRVDLGDGVARTTLITVKK